jgi:CRISPR-associated protein Csh2
MNLNNEPLKSRNILFIYDSRDCNPNGERETGFEGPRIDPLTSKAIVSDVSLKRTMRDYFLNSCSGSSDKIMLRQKFEYNKEGRISIQQSLLNDIQKTEKELNELPFNEIKKEIEEHFIDQRLFGSMLLIKNQFVGTTGPVQFENSLSFNIPKVYGLPITTNLASEKGKGAGSMGKYSFLNYAIFPVHGIVKQSLSEKSGAKEKDSLKLFESMWEGVKSITTRTKFQQMPRLLISIIYKDYRFQNNGLKSSIDLTKRNVSCFNDCIFIIDSFIEQIKKYEKEITKIEYKEDKDTKYQFKGEEFKRIKDIFDSLNINIQMEEIMF